MGLLETAVESPVQTSPVKGKTKNYCYKNGNGVPKIRNKSLKNINNGLV